jgi:hypothetical protein
MSVRLGDMGKPIVTTAAERRSDSYQPDFDIDMKVGAQAELFVAHIIDSLSSSRGAVEVKYDAKFYDTGNVYVEYQCLRRGEWTKSGIATTKAAFWTFVLGMDTFCFTVATATLKSAVLEKWPDPRCRKELTRGSHPTKGVVLPYQWLATYAAKTAL